MKATLKDKDKEKRPYTKKEKTGIMVTSLKLPQDLMKQLKYVALDHNTTLSVLMTEAMVDIIKKKRSIKKR